MSSISRLFTIKKVVKEYYNFLGKFYSSRKNYNATVYYNQTILQTPIQQGPKSSGSTDI